MASSASKIIRAVGKGFDAERKKIALQGTTAYLLVRSGQTAAFSSLVQLTNAWKSVFSEFRVQMNLQIATEDTDVVLAIQKASDMSIDGYIYQIDDRDKYPPDGNHSYWRVFGTKTGEIFDPTPTP